MFLLFLSEPHQLLVGAGEPGRNHLWSFLLQEDIPGCVTDYEHASHSSEDQHLEGDQEEVLDAHFLQKLALDRLIHISDTYLRPLVPAV